PRAPSDFDALDRERFQIGSRIFGIEHLAVEEGLLAARGGGWNLRGCDTEGLGSIAPHVFAVDLADQRLAVEGSFIFAPSDVLGHEPEIMALERIGGEVAPVLHDVR